MHAKGSAFIQSGHFSHRAVMFPLNLLLLGKCDEFQNNMGGFCCSSGPIIFTSQSNQPIRCRDNGMAVSFIPPLCVDGWTDFPVFACAITRHTYRSKPARTGTVLLRVEKNMYTGCYLRMCGMLTYQSPSVAVTPLTPPSEKIAFGIPPIVI